VLSYVFAVFWLVHYYACWLVHYYACWLMHYYACWLMHYYAWYADDLYVLSVFNQYIFLIVFYCYQLTFILFIHKLFLLHTNLQIPFFYRFLKLFNDWHLSIQSFMRRSKPTINLSPLHPHITITLSLDILINYFLLHILFLQFHHNAMISLSLHLIVLDIY